MSPAATPVVVVQGEWFCSHSASFSGQKSGSQGIVGRGTEGEQEEIGGLSTEGRANRPPILSGMLPPNQSSRVYREAINTSLLEKLRYRTTIGSPLKLISSAVFG